MKNSKTLLFAAVLTCCAALADASMITLSCVNIGNTIRLPGFNQAPVVEILVSKYDATGKMTDIVQSIEKEDLVISESGKTELRDESNGCSSSSTYALKIKFARKDGKPMPNAYTRNADKDGSLEDIFLCKTSRNSSPMGRCGPR